MNKIFRDTDKTLGYEYNSFFKKIVNIFFVPLLNNLPKKFQNYIKKSNKNAKEVIDNATTHVALEIIYHAGKTKHKSSLMKKLFRSVWFNLSNTKAARNRLKLTKREIKKKVYNCLEKKEPIAILSIAAGSARAVIESILECAVPKEYPVTLYFIDKNPVATNYSKTIIESNDHFDHYKTKWFTMTIGEFFKNEAETVHGGFSVVEMVGLLDYFDDEKAVDVFSKIRKVLANEGVLVTANICPNPEQPFITKVVDWRMIYRKPLELSLLLEHAGFQKKDQCIYQEPLLIHTVITSKNIRI